MYEIGSLWYKVYSTLRFTVNCCYLQVYNFTVQQIVYSKLLVTPLDLHVIILEVYLLQPPLTQIIILMIYTHPVHS